MQQSASRQKFDANLYIDLCVMANSSISTMVSPALSAIRSELTGVNPGGEQTRPEENDGDRGTVPDAESNPNLNILKFFLS